MIINLPALPGDKDGLVLASYWLTVRFRYCIINLKGGD